MWVCPSQNTKIIIEHQSMACWNDISLCSGGVAWRVLVLDAAVAAVVAGCVVPQCQGRRGWLSRQTHRGGGNLIAQPSPSLMSVYPATIYERVCLTDSDCWTLPIYMEHSPCFSAVCTTHFICSKKLHLCLFRRTLENKSSVCHVATVLTWPSRTKGCDDIGNMKWHVWRRRDGGAACIWCGGRKLLCNEEGRRIWDGKWGVGGRT